MDSLSGIHRDIRGLKGLETLSLDQLDDIALRNLGWAQQQHPVGDAYFGSTDAYNRLLDLTVLRFLIATSKRQKPVDMHVFARHTRGVFRDFQTKMQQMKRARIGQLRFPALNVTVLVDAMRVDKGAKITDGIMQLWVEETSFEGQATRVLETTPATETEMESPIASQILADRSLELSIFERPVWHTATTTNLPLCGFAYRAQPPQDTRLFDVTGNTLRGVSGPPVGVLVSLRGMHLEQIKRTLTGYVPCLPVTVLTERQSKPCGSCDCRATRYRSQHLSHTSEMYNFG